MSRKESRRKTVGHPTSSAFGPTLRWAIQQEFQTNKSFANRLDRSPSRVSQIIKGLEAVDASSLGRILGCFERPDLREVIHAAWVRQFAPLPPLSLIEDVVTLQRHIEGLVQLGRVRPALSLAIDAYAQAADHDVRQNMLERQVQLHSRLTDTAAAMAALNLMEATAKGSSRTDLLTALWMKLSILTKLPSAPVSRFKEAYGDAIALAGSWKPELGDARALWKHRLASLERDRAIFILTAVEHRALGRDAISLAREAAVRSLELSDSVALSCTGLEVRARVEVAEGHPFTAEETLEELRGRGVENGSELWEKEQLTRARILALRGEVERAVALLTELGERCLDRFDLHHFGQATSLRLTLEARP
jgi:hypothetical protein